MTSPFQSSVRLDHDHAATVLEATASGDRLGFYAQPFVYRRTQVVGHVYSADLLILAVSGELDVTTSPLLQRKLNQPLPACTVIDLSGVTFLGAAGLGVLETACARTRAERRRMGLVTATSSVLRILRLFALDVRVPVYPRLSDAVREVALQHPVYDPGPSS
ncbi:STAS domain-containing protein [Amycolatopsis sp. cmx-11-51]|uniref:STAS domain-containing protein n=1 Tax=unclassified Amycolatopsis TaxID=2618356 RepID=UPI0039E39DF0